MKATLDPLAGEAQCTRSVRVRRSFESAFVTSSSSTDPSCPLVALGARDVTGVRVPRRRPDSMCSGWHSSRKRRFGHVACDE